MPSARSTVPPVEVVEPVVLSVFVAVDTVVVEIAFLPSNPEAKYNVPFVHDNGCATVRLAPLKVCPSPSSSRQIK